MNTFELENKKVFVAGHKGMVGMAVIKKLEKENCQIITIDKSKVNLMMQRDVETWMKEHLPDVVIICAAKVGGILANNSYPAEFIYNNLMIAANLIHAAHLSKVKKLIYLGSSCIYPKNIGRPLNENDLLTGELEPTNQWYAIAKISGIKLCQAYRKQYKNDFISAMPTNLYGPGDTYDTENSHVIPALIKKFLNAKKKNLEDIEIWGTGNVKREFLYVDDCASGIIYLLKNYSNEEHVNIGYGEDISIKDLAKLIAEITEYQGELIFNSNKLEGTVKKLLNSHKINKMGWKPSTSLRDGLKKTISLLQ